MWAVFLIAGIPAVAAVIAAGVAARSAAHARTAEAETERLRLLEDRVSERKYEVYRPMIDSLARMLDPGLGTKPSEAEMRERLTEFAGWVGVFGSDEAVLAFRNFMQGTFADAPASVILRLYSDFQLAARRDMGDPQTKLAPADLIAMRINDLYTGDSAMYDAMTLPFEEACRRANWNPPWLKGQESREPGGGRTPLK